MPNLTELKAALAKAVKAEDYAKAAELQKQIKALEAAARERRHDGDSDGGGYSDSGGYSD